jgi:putative oxidoreductase
VSPFRGVSNVSATQYDPLGLPLQRLFSTFPNSWPGVGLLIVRLCLGTALISFGTVDFSFKTSGDVGFVQNLVAAVGGVFLVAGLWTPLMASLVALEEACRVPWIYAVPRECAWIHAFLAMLSVSVAMLGPGAWSIDARLFGRKRLDIDRSRARKP